MWRSFNLLACAIALLSAVGARAAERTFDFKDPKGVNAIAFGLDSLLEPIFGHADGVSGTVTFDPAKVKEAKGSLVVETKSLKLTHPTMTEHAHGPDWLDSANHPKIVFELKKVEDVKTAGEHTWELEVEGDFILKGKTEKLKAPVTVMLIPDGMTKRTGEKVKGDLLVIRTEFTLDRSKFGIKPGEALDKVANNIKVWVSVVGYAPPQ
jgi:polyisoprenoid-binding protein YceI